MAITQTRIDIKKLVAEHGAENVMFISKVSPLRKVMMISYTSSSDKEIDMLCRIDEERYKVKEGYKITLRPIYDGFAHEHYYQSDLESLIKEGRVTLLLKHKGGI